MAKADALTLADSAFDGAVVAFGGVIWNQGNDFGHEDPPWPTYRGDLHDLLAAYRDSVVAGGLALGGRFWWVNAAASPYPDVPRAQARQYLDAEADVCAGYAFCSLVEAADEIRRRYDACTADTCYARWYNTHHPDPDEQDGHWAQGALDYVGRQTARLVVAHDSALALGRPDPFAWEVGVEVPSPVDVDTTDPTAYHPTRLRVYDDTGAIVDSFDVDSTIAHPDWRADFDGDDPEADWRPDWGSLSTAFLTLEFVWDPAGAADTLARYVYVPTEAVYGATDEDFYRPAPTTGPGDVRFEVVGDGGGGPVAVEAHTAFVGPPFEAGFGGAYVLPYNHGAFAAGCLAAGSTRCPDGLPGYFLARLPEDAPVPDEEEHRFTFAAEADATVPSTWGSVEWDADPVRVLAFPEGRRLVVTADLTASDLTLTEAEPDERWDGLAVYTPGSLDLDRVTVTKAAVGVDVNSTGNALADVLLDSNGVGLLTGYVCSLGVGGCTSTRSAFSLTESCVTNSEFVLNGTEGYGIWGRHTNGTVSKVTIGTAAAGPNDAYGLLLDNADLTASRLDLRGNGAAAAADDGAHVLAGGELTLADLSIATGQNRIEANTGTELEVAQGGYAVVGVASAMTPQNHLARAVSGGSGLIVFNEAGNAQIPAVRAYWGTGTFPPSGSIQGSVNFALPLPASPSSSAGRTGGCDDAGAGFQGGGSFAIAAGPGGAPEVGADSTGELDPEAAAWFVASVDSLQAALAAAPDDAALVGELYALQRLDRADALGEHAETMAMIAAIRAPLAAGGDTLTAAERAAGEAALVAGVHDALRADRAGEARALLAPFVSEQDPLPEVEGDQTRWTLALALAALDEGAGDVPSALARLHAVLAELGPEEEALTRDLETTAALLARQLEGEDAGDRQPGPSPSAASESDLPTAYALGPPYPNPTTGRTTVPFALPAGAHVALHVYDVLGRRVAVLADGPFAAGRHTAVLDGGRLASGLYVVRAVIEPENGAAARAFTRRVTLVR